MKRLTIFILLLIVLVGGFLRMYKIPTNPPGLYTDEVSIGLNAYDILTTGKDQFGIAHPLFFRSLDDYKVPGYIYIVAGSMKIFGKNEFAIRFPSALAGTFTIVVIFFLLRNLLRLGKTAPKHADTLSLLAAGLFAITPWHLHFSRGGFEVVVALFFYTLGIYLALKFWQTKKIWLLILVSALFIAAMYTYDSYRLMIPLTVAIGFFLGIRDKEKRKSVFAATIFLAVCALPLVLFSLTPQGQARFQATSAFFENPYTSGLLKIGGDIVIFLRNYLSYFSLTYLFRFGDQINRHQVNDIGILYVWQLPFIIAGIYFLVKAKNKALSFVISLFLFLGIVPPAIARPSPHTLRFLIGSIPYTVLTALGVYHVFLQKGKWVKPLLVVVGIFACIELGYYLNYYYVNYPKEALIDWGGSCKEVAQTIQQDTQQFKHIVIDKNVDCIQEYFLFYIPQTKPLYVSTSWIKPKQWGTENVLYVRPFYGNAHPEGLVENIYLPNNNRDIFAQLYSL